MAIIALSGYAKSGKSTVAEIIRTIQPRWEIKSFAGKLREVASVLTGIPPDMFKGLKDNRLPGYDMTIREFLQKLGTDAIRNNLHQDTWVNALFSEYKETDKWIIDDCRFPNEAQIVSDFGGKIWRINRPGVTATNNHTSETALDDWFFDVVIENTGDKDFLKSQIEELCKKN